MTDTPCAPRRTCAPARLAALLASSLLVMACGATPGETAGDSADTRGQSEPAALVRAASPASDNPFSVEEAMGAECRPDYGGDPPLQGAACYGLLPGHLRSLLRRLPETHPNLSREARLEAAANSGSARCLVMGSGRTSLYTSPITASSGCAPSRARIRGSPSMWCMGQPAVTIQSGPCGPSTKAAFPVRRMWCVS